VNSYKNGRLSDLIHETSSEDFSYDDLSRREVRSIIFHLLYAMEGFDYQISLESIVDNFNRGFDLNIPLESESFSVAQAVITQRHELDEKIKPLLHNWRFDRIGVCTKLILRAALWELFYTDTPANVVINEAIELAKCFAEKDAYKFINGLLDEQVKKMGRNNELAKTPNADDSADNS
jgi:transcription antitermination protein NusB